MMIYAINVALMLAGCFLFYKLLLQKETFFPLNRFVLLGCLFLSFSLPLIPVPQQWSLRKTSTETVLSNISASKTVDKNIAPSLNTAIVKSDQEKNTDCRSILF